VQRFQQQTAVKMLDDRRRGLVADQGVGDFHQRRIEHSGPGHTDAAQATPAAVLNRRVGAGTADFDLG
jgi:hypothetical protein